MGLRQTDFNAAGNESGGCGGAFDFSDEMKRM